MAPQERPEAAIGREATYRWRTGRSVGRTIYAQVSAEPSDADVLIGVMDSPELADEAVRAHNVLHAQERPGAGDAQEYPSSVPAYLGWGNPERDKVGLRLYATDQGGSPRWDKRFPGGRVLEYALRPAEGDRYLVVRLGDRFVSDDVAERVAAALAAALREGEEA